MAFKDKLETINKLQQKIEAAGKLSKEVLQKINNKFRLDWNYYSNRMEGNTLTIEETKNIMIGNIDVRNKPLKDVMEMKGHDDAIQNILKMGKGELNVSEFRIKELHKTIMYEENKDDKEKIGKWKTENNHVINYKNEKFEFIPASEVPAKMHELMNWLSAEKEKIAGNKKDKMHPVQLAFDFHFRYLTIHPFYDGNGRTGRILTNLILISYGYPPVYIKDEDKKTYYRFLAEVQAYGADIFLFFDLMSHYLIRSMELVTNAIEGKEIEEPGDLDKKIQILETELKIYKPKDEIKTKYSAEVFISNMKLWIIPLIDLVIPVIQKYNKFFTRNDHNINMLFSDIDITFSDESSREIIDKLNNQIDMELLGPSDQEFTIDLGYKRFIKGGINAFNCSSSITIKFEDIKYELYVDDFDEIDGSLKPILMYERLLDKSLKHHELEEISNKIGNTIYQYLDFHTKKIGLRK